MIIRLISFILMLAFFPATKSFSKSPDTSNIGDLEEVLLRIGNQTTYRHRPLRIRYNEDRDICNVGYLLFNDSIVNQTGDSILFSFIERYFLLLDLLEDGSENVTRRMADDHVYINHGSRKDIYNCSSPNLDIEIARISMDKMPFIKMVFLNQDNNSEISISFPASYELLLGKKRGDLENVLLKQLSKASNKFIDKTFAFPLIEQIDTGIFVNPSANSYLTEELNNKVYYTIDSLHQAVPVFLQEYPRYSIANLMLGQVDEPRNVSIKQKLYGYKEIDIQTTLHQLTNFFSSENLDIYFAIEKEYDDSFAAVMMAVQPELMYNHLLTLNIPKDIIGNANAIVTGSISTYIPTHNVANIFQENERTIR